ncbi:hypothetical protein GSF08_02270 [Clostridiaceae bacterium DONG20-135]|uniref:Polysaccharide deacetylase n=1 Tax=Copranaerobaculum intestinale TaxID=2692629 RepID=A0A6N8U3M4_9FIRM|nr:hypothetical protein [Copranaerobaculum intestinale]MXQ72772.1 hypothetical protein [Copranaerobaculum intestinale]
MHEFLPSYSEYEKILKNLINSGKYCDYSEAPRKDKFIVLRHDIEFSIDRAYYMSLLETKYGLVSSYFVQITNNSYNAFSQKNIKMLQEMIRNGHHVGLHYHCNGCLDSKKIKKGIKNEIPVLESMLGNDIKIDRFSMHRPAKQSRYWEIKIPNIINTYAEDYFVFDENANITSNLGVKYISDSKHRWNYGFPDEKTLRENDKIQILIHPFSWTEKGLSNENNFKSLINEKTLELMDTFSNEFQRYEECRENIHSEYIKLKYK